MQQSLAITISLIIGLLLPGAGFADEASARLAMENPQHPLLRMQTSQGDVYIELLTEAAPQNSARFLALALGEHEFRDPLSGTSTRPRYFDGMVFHRVIPGFLIQTGSPFKSPFGEPQPLLRDEINAAALGLDLTPAILPAGTLNPLLNLGDRESLEQILLLPLYREAGISDATTLESRQFSLVEQLRQMSVRDVYQRLGYRYQENLPARSISRGTVVLANQGPDTNGGEFFIPVVDTPWLNGRHTVIGHVVDGMDTVDRISRRAIDPASDNPQSTLITGFSRI